MIGYVTLGSNDKEKAAAFYDALMAEIGAKRIFNNDRLIFWGTEMGAPMIGVGTPSNGETASFGNGTMVALAVGSRENADKLYAKAIALGATDEGACLGAWLYRWHLAATYLSGWVCADRDSLVWHPPR